MKRTIFVKKNDHYGSKYRIETQIVQDPETGALWSVKSPSCPEASAHVQEMAVISQELPKILDKLTICPCKLEDGKAFFPYIPGRSLLSLLIEAAKTSKEAYLALWKEYFERMQPSEAGRCVFKETEAFVLLFGEGFANVTVPAYQTCAFDMLPTNIIVRDDGQWVLFDYEWRLPFPVPVELILFHAAATVSYFYQETGQAAELDEILRLMDPQIPFSLSNQAREHFLGKLAVNDASTDAVQSLYNRYKKTAIDIGQVMAQAESLRQEKDQIIQGWNAEHAHALDIDRERMALLAEKEKWEDLRDRLNRWESDNERNLRWYQDSVRSLAEEIKAVTDQADAARNLLQAELAEKSRELAERDKLLTSLRDELSQITAQNKDMEKELSGIKRSKAFRFLRFLNYF